jgi:hypothetical protein
MPRLTSLSDQNHKQRPHRLTDGPRSSVDHEPTRPHPGPPDAKSKEFKMQSTRKTASTSRSLWRGLALSTLALAATLPAMAQNSPSPALEPRMNCAPAEISLAAPLAQVQPIHEGPLSRAEVIEQLKSAKAAGTMTLSGEMGDSPEVLAHREAFNALQTEVYDAQVAAAQAQQMAAASCIAAQPIAALPADAEPAQLHVSADTTLAELMDVLAQTEGYVVLVVDEDVEADAV